MKELALHRNLVRAFSLSAFIVALDQAAKLWVKGFSLLGVQHTGMELGSSIPLIGSLLSITYIENPGMAFGIEVGSQIALALLSLVACTGVVYYLWKMRDESLLVPIPMSMILGGAVGNLIDRTFYGIFFGYAPLFYGRVVDFVDVRLLHLSHLGIFNLADASVTIGIVWLILFRKSLQPATSSVPQSGPATTVAQQGLDSQGQNGSGAGSGLQNVSK